MRFIVAVAVALSLSGCIFRTTAQSYPWESRLPEGVKIIAQFDEMSGMDAFHLVRLSYVSEDQIVQICNEFKLLPHEEGKHGSHLGMAGLVDERSPIAWFPPATIDRVYFFSSENNDGSLKLGVNGRYQNMLWVDEEQKELVLQVVAM